MEKINIPALDLEKLNERAQEAAMKGAIAEIDEFYTGYKSPYKEAVKAHLEAQKISWSFTIPDILAVMNEKMSAEVDTIANTAVANSFVPLIQEFLVREDKEMKLSDVLKKFIEESDMDDQEPDDFEVDLTRSTHGWYTVKLSNSVAEYDLTLHENYVKDKDPDPLKRVYKFLSLPYDRRSDKVQSKMKLTIENATLEMPFTREILSDKFTSFIARLVIGGTNITIDTQRFDHDWFPNDHCHCD